MAADTSVKWLSNTMTGAPSMNGNIGTMITVFDAVLVNGFNTQTVDSIVVSGGIATVTRAAGNLPSVRGTLGAQVGTVVKIAGATPDGLNGEKRILTTGYVAGTSFQFDATGISDQTATGTITCTTAGLGWNKVYSGTNKAIYQRTDVNATGSVLYVDDTTTNHTFVGTYEVSNQSLLSTGSGFTNGAPGYYPKSSTADTTARTWTIIGDSRGFFIQVNYQASNTNICSHHMFGDIAPVKQNDPYSCFIRAWDGGYTGNNTKYMNSTPSGQEYGDLWASTQVPGIAVGCAHLQRSSYGFGSPVQARTIWLHPAAWTGTSGNPSSSYMYSGGGNGVSGSYPGSYNPSTLNVPMAPNAADNGLYLTPMTLLETNSSVYRGTIPGIYAVPQWVPAGYFGDNQTFSGTGSSSGRIMLNRLSGSGHGYGTQSYLGSVVYDVTGPWAR